MVVQLIITEEMIICFHQCTVKNDYQLLFKDYQPFFEDLTENLCKVKFRDPLNTAIVKESKFFMDCLSKLVPKSVLPWEEKTVNPDLNIYGFFQRFVLAIETKDWDSFYYKFLPIIDLLVGEARRQKIIDLKIRFGLGLYETFSLRDKAACALNQEVKPQAPQNNFSAICSSGHFSRSLCNSNCSQFLKTVYGTERIVGMGIFGKLNRTERLVITERLITCFHECAEKRDFKKLFEDYFAFFDKLNERLSKVNPTTDHLSTILFKNSKRLLGYLTKWDPNESLPWDDGEAYRFESYFSGLVPHLHIAMVIRDWDGFYQLYRPVADMLMKEARQQQLIDLKIEYKGELFDSFETRDTGMGPPKEQPSMSFKKDFHRQPTTVLKPPPGVETEPKMKRESSLSNKGSKHVSFAEPVTKNPESLIVPNVLKVEPEVQQSIPTEIPERTMVDEISKVSPEPKTENVQDNQQGLFIRMESVLQKWSNKAVDHTLSPNENLKTMETDQKNLETHFDQQLSNANVSSNEKFDDRRERNLEVDEKIEKAMNDMKISTEELLVSMGDTVQQIVNARIEALKAAIMNEMEKRLAEIVVGIGSVRGNEQRERNNELLGDCMKYIEKQLERERMERKIDENKKMREVEALEEPLSKKMEAEIERKILKQTEQFKLREDKPIKKLEEIKILEELNKKMEEMVEKSIQKHIEQLKWKERKEQNMDELLTKIERNAQKQREQLKLKEETLDRKIEEFMDKKIEEMIERSVQEQLKLNENSLNEKNDSLNDNIVAMIKQSVQEQKEQLILKEDLLNKKMEEIIEREDSLNEKTEAAIRKSVQEQVEKLKLREDLVNKKFGEMEALEKSLNKTMEAAIEKSVQEQKEQLKLKDDLLNKKMEEIIVREDSLNKKMEAMIERNVHEHDEQLKLREETLDKKIEGIKVREELLNNKIEAEIERSVQKQWAQNEHLVNKNMVSLNDDITAMVERSVQEQKEQLKLKEDLLNKKTEEIKIRGDSLDEKMEAAIRKSTQQQKEQLELKEEMLDGKIVEVKAKEELLDRKIDAMLELMELFKHQNQPKVTVAHCSKSSDDCSSGTAITSKDRCQDKKEATDPGPRNCPSTLEPTSSRSPPIEGLSDDDEEIRQMQEKFEKELAEQDAKNAAEMKEVKERGRQKNEKAQAEIRELSRSVSRTRDQASFRL